MTYKRVKGRQHTMKLKDELHADMIAAEIRALLSKIPELQRDKPTTGSQVTKESRYSYIMKDGVTPQFIDLGYAYDFYPTAISVDGLLDALISITVKSTGVVSGYLAAYSTLNQQSKDKLARAIGAHLALVEAIDDNAPIGATIDPDAANIGMKYIDDCILRAESTISDKLSHFNGFEFYEPL